MKKTFVLALGVLVFALAACSGGAAPSAPAQQVTLNVSEFKFEPANLEVTAGKAVKLTLVNKGSVEHDWAIMKIPMTGMTDANMGGHNMGGAADAPELHMSAAAGKSATIEFTPSQKGTYSFICMVAGHKEAGMVGTLVVK
jgi:uncharacterized cupredoxin-like copper-binding protein